MTQNEFEQRRKHIGMDVESRTAKAAHLVLVGKLSLTEAAVSVGISVSVVSRGIARLKKAVLPEITCPECGTKFVA